MSCVAEGSKLPTHSVQMAALSLVGFSSSQFVPEQQSVARVLADGEELAKSFLDD